MSPKGSSKLTVKSPGSASVCRIPARLIWVHHKVADPGDYGRFPASDVTDRADPQLIYTRPTEMSTMVRALTRVISGRRLGETASTVGETESIGGGAGGNYSPD